MKKTTLYGWRAVSVIAMLTMAVGCAKTVPQETGDDSATAQETPTGGNESAGSGTEPSPSAMNILAPRLIGSSIGAYTLSLGNVTDALDDEKQLRFNAALAFVGREAVVSGNGGTVPKNMTRDEAITLIARRVNGMTADDVIALADSMNSDFQAIVEGGGEN